MDWYVYIAKYDDKVVYIGKGKNERYKHLNSGISSCYHANKVHFSGGVIDVSIDSYFDSSEKALAHEKLLIDKMEPTWNVTFSNTESAKLKRSQRARPKNFIRGKSTSPKGRSQFFGLVYRPKGIGGKYTEKKHWTVKFKYDGKHIHVGNYVREIDAAIARDLYIINNDLEGFTLNFPDKNYSEVLDEYIEWG